MAKIVQRRRGTTTEHSSFIGLLGEITVDTTLKTVVVHDGTTAGGFDLARSDGSNLTSISSNSVGIIQLDVSDGTSGQVLSTNGSGVLSFIDVGLTSLGITDGTNGQILQTDGAGTLSFVDRPSDGAAGAGGGISLALAIAVG